MDAKFFNDNVITNEILDNVSLSTSSIINQEISDRRLLLFGGLQGHRKACEQGSFCYEVILWSIIGIDESR